MLQSLRLQLGRVFLIVSLTIFLKPTIAQTPDFETVQVGDPAPGQFQYGRRVVTLPEGKWRLIVKLERSAAADGTGATMLEAAFDEVLDRRLNRTLQLTLTKYSKTGTWLDEPCKSLADSYWLDDRKRSFNDQFCLRVGFVTGMVEGARGQAFQEWARQITASSTLYSPEMPYLSVVRFTTYDFLRMSISFNPALSGISRSAQRERHLNDWNPRSPKFSANHEAFYAALQNWAPTFAAAAQRAFEGDETLKQSDFGSPKLP